MMVQPNAPRVIAQMPPQAAAFAILNAHLQTQCPLQRVLDFLHVGVDEFHLFFSVGAFSLGVQEFLHISLGLPHAHGQRRHLLRRRFRRRLRRNSTRR